ncbi:HEAT repeat domain-containing protein [Salarchaeum sp. JOR-1]|uniref:HEAT repeat domain-containing protein n=1 Tax=Salarchaeum sp. JOR-1 TaxID=2599399 RepID=UPI001198AB5C|nr:HEAT repeat domain-containing protein [Salarchaeum sp. JOR-1]QDX41312.1 HEAT repeat domain-containing protein [Salarchaeum sp. JOR-1]
MSDEDADSADQPAENDADAEAEAETDAAEPEPGTVAAFEERLDDAEAALDDAETESGLDDVDALLDGIESDLDDANLPEPDEDEEDDDPREELESRLSDIRSGVEDQRGPYAEAVVSDVNGVKTTVEGTRWTANGADAVVEAVQAFATAVNDTVSADVRAPDDLDTAAFDDFVAAIEDADLDADEDADEIAALLDATDTLESSIEDAEEWTDLSVREQLRRDGYYDALGGKFKDFPPEWSALKEWERRDDAEMVLLLIEKMGDSEYMKRHALDALTHMGNENALDKLSELANRREIPAIEAIGKIGSADGLNAVQEYTESESNPELQKAGLRAVGEIGSEEATQDVANQLVSENESVRSVAARSLGLLGDTRAIDPLAGVLADADESESVRASAAWALVQIGTKRALDAAAEYADERSFLVQQEAQKAQRALDA